MNFINNIFSINDYCDEKREKGKLINIFGLKFKLKKKSEGLNIGAGKFMKPGWDVVDWYINDKYIDYKVILLEKTSLPIEDNKYSYVFTSHLIEHLSDEADENLFKEVYRIMKKGGIFRISCPDGEKAINAYKNGDKEFFFLDEIVLKGHSAERRLLNFFASFKCKNYGEAPDYIGGPIVDDETVKEKVKELSMEDFVKWCVSQIPKEAYYVAHINGHTFKKVSEMLKKAGFKDIKKSSYKKSRVRQMRGKMFDNRPNSSLYVEAVK